MIDAEAVLLVEERAGLVSYGFAYSAQSSSIGDLRQAVLMVWTVSELSVATIAMDSERLRVCEGESEDSEA